MMKGVLGADSVTYKAEGSWVLNHQFFNLKITEISTPPKYEANIYIGYNNQKKILLFTGLIILVVAFPKPQVTETSFEIQFLCILTIRTVCSEIF